MERGRVKKAGYCRKFYGKKLTVTDHKDWTSKEILEEYSRQECIENGIFRVSKDIDHFSVRPQHHWTDDKIRVHVFICLTAIVIAEIMRKHFEENGHYLTKGALLDRLGEVHDGWVFIGKKSGTCHREGRHVPSGTLGMRSQTEAGPVPGKE